MSDQKSKTDHYLSSEDAASRAAAGTTTTGGGAGAATAQEPWDEAKAYLSPFEERLSLFINRRINAQPNVTVSVSGRKAEVLEYLPGGTGLGRLKVQTALQAVSEIVDVDETTFEMLVAKIVQI